MPKPVAMTQALSLEAASRSATIDRRTVVKGLTAAAMAAAVGSAGGRAGASEGLAMSWDEWGSLDATGLARLLAADRVTPAEVAAQAAKAAELINPQLNCVIEVFDDAVANPLADGMNVSGPFHGVPMFMKDTGSHMKGRLQEKNSFFYKGNRGEYDDPLTRNLRRAGLNLIGRTPIPSGGFHVTEGLLTGITRSPWNTDHTSGGSSGGSSASVASGIVPICHASDGGGSTRSPAVLCGLVGHKPTRGLLPFLHGLTYDMLYMVVEGVITKTVRDQAAAYDQMIWRAPADKAFIPIQMPDTPFAEQIRRDPPRLRIALNTGNWSRRDASESARPVSPEVIARTAEVAALLESLGHDVVEVNDDDICDFAKLFQAFEWFYLYGNQWEALSERSGVPITEETLEPAYFAMIEHQKANPMPQGTVDAARAANAELAGQWASFFAGYDLLLTPADGDGAMKVEGPISPFVELDSEVAYLDWIDNHMDDARYFIPDNAMGLPAIAIPTGVLGSGLPCGAQLHGRWGADGLILQTGAQIERAKPEWFNMVPPVHVSRL